MVITSACENVYWRNVRSEENSIQPGLLKKHSMHRLIEEISKLVAGCQCIENEQRCSIKAMAQLPASWRILRESTANGAAAAAHHAAGGWPAASSKALAGCVLWRQSLAASRLSATHRKIVA